MTEVPNDNHHDATNDQGSERQPGNGPLRDDPTLGDFSVDPVRGTEADSGIGGGDALSGAAFSDPHEETADDTGREDSPETTERGTAAGRAVVEHETAMSNEGNRTEGGNPIDNQGEGQTDTAADNGEADASPTQHDQAAETAGTVVVGRETTTRATADLRHNTEPTANYISRERAADLYARLAESRDASVRREIARDLIGDMSNGSPVACSTYADLCHLVRERLDIDNREPSQTGEISALTSIELAREAERVGGFLSSIASTPAPGTILEVGAGSGVLSAGAALTHPDSEVIAYEINTEAAQCMKAVFDLLGLKDQVSVINADARTVTFPPAAFAFSETFGPGLLGEHEPGPELIPRLNEVADIVTPQSAAIFARDRNISGTEDIPWTRAGAVDLRVPNTHVEGSFTSNKVGNRVISAYSLLLDGRGNPLVTGKPGVNTLTAPLFLGIVPINSPGERVHFRYKLGAVKDFSPTVSISES